MNEERDLIVGRVVEVGDVAALGNKPGIVIETTAEQLYAPGRSFAFCEVEIRLKDNTNDPAHRTQGAETTKKV